MALEYSLTYWITNPKVLPYCQLMINGKVDSAYVINDATTTKYFGYVVITTDLLGNTDRKHGFDAFSEAHTYIINKYQSDQEKVYSPLMIRYIPAKSNKRG